MFDRRSALHTAVNAGGRRGSVDQQRLRIGEVRGWTLVQVSAFTGTISDLRQAVQDVLHADLPTQMGTVTNEEGRRLLKIGATQFWIITPSGHDPGSSLRAAISPHIGAVVSLTHSRACIAIEGAVAGELLAMGIALDFHLSTFGVGQYALAGLHHMPVLVHRVRANRFELYAIRTFAQSIRHWLVDAASSLEHAVEMETK